MALPIDFALRRADELLRALEMIYAEREHGTEPPAAKLKQLERLIENAATHPALADSGGFRK